jgi:transposase
LGGSPRFLSLAADRGQDAGIKLDSVASDLLGVSGRAMLRALIAGQRDPHQLAQLARGRLRNKLPELTDEPLR